MVAEYRFETARFKETLILAKTISSQDEYVNFQPLW